MESKSTEPLATTTCMTSVPAHEHNVGIEELHLFGNKPWGLTCGVVGSAARPLLSSAFRNAPFAIFVCIKQAQMHNCHMLSCIVTTVGRSGSSLVTGRALSFLSQPARRAAY